MCARCSTRAEKSKRTPSARSVSCEAGSSVNGSNAARLEKPGLTELDERGRVRSAQALACAAKILRVVVEGGRLLCRPVRDAEHGQRLQARRFDQETRQAFAQG